MLTTSVALHFPTAILVQEQRYHDCRPLCHVVMDSSSSEKTMLDRRRMEIGFSAREESGNFSSASSCLLLSFKKEVFSTSKRAVLLTVSYKSCEADLDETSTSSEVTTSSSEFSFEKKNIVKSTRLSKRKEVVRRKRLKPTSPKKEVDYEGYWLPPVSNKIVMPNGRLTVKYPQLDRAKEYELIINVQRLTELVKVENKLCSKLGRQPYLVEWAKAAKVSCPELKSQLVRGYVSRKKLISLHVGAMVHIAQKYQSYGLDVRDLCQEACQGFLHGIERFRVDHRCRLLTYAYYWMRVFVQRAATSHSRLISLPDHIYDKMAKVAKAKRLLRYKGVLDPTKEDIAAFMGITMVQLETLYIYSMRPISTSMYIRDPDADPDSEEAEPYMLQDALEDPKADDAYVSLMKELVREKLQKMMNALTPRENYILRLRYGFEETAYGRVLTFEEIAGLYGLSKQRIKQIEIKAMEKLKESLASEGVKDCVEYLHFATSSRESEYYQWLSKVIPTRGHSEIFFGEQFSWEQFSCEQL